MNKFLWATALGGLMLALGSAGCTIDDTYGGCNTTADCADPLDQCLEVSIPAEGTLGAFCSSGCDSDLQCESAFGFPGRCYSLEGSSNICYQACDFDSDCFSSSVCIEVALDGGVVDFICVPDNL
ncbi:MAG: hypothetical protein AB8I08_34270 [Sandaracinaceae bacterium]